MLSTLPPRLVVYLCWNPPLFLLLLLFVAHPFKYPVLFPLSPFFSPNQVQGHPQETSPVPLKTLRRGSPPLPFTLFLQPPRPFRRPYFLLSLFLLFVTFLPLFPFFALLLSLLLPVFSFFFAPWFLPLQTSQPRPSVISPLITFDAPFLGVFTLHGIIPLSATALF